MVIVFASASAAGRQQQRRLMTATEGLQLLVVAVTVAAADAALVYCGRRAAGTLLLASNCYLYLVAAAEMAAHSNRNGGCGSKSASLNAGIRHLLGLASKNFSFNQHACPSHFRLQQTSPLSPQTSDLLQSHEVPSSTSTGP